MSQSKTCTKCKVPQSHDDFHHDKRTKDGLTQHCKGCRRQYYESRKNNPQVRQRNKEYAAAYYKKNKEHIIKKQLERYQKTGYADQKTYQRRVREQWKLTGKDLFNDSKRRAKQYKRTFTLTWEEFRDIIKQPCYYCGTTQRRRGVDRVNNQIGYELENCQPCCARCNWMKSNLDLEEFIEHCGQIYSKIRTIKHRAPKK